MKRDDPVDPGWLDLANMRLNGAHEVDVACGCGRLVTVNVDRLDGRIKALAAYRYCRCSICGERPIGSRPHWPAHSTSRMEVEGVSDQWPYASPSG